MLEYYRERGCDRIFIPCTGQNTVVKTALDAGFLPEQIFSSDISLFSSMLGYLYSGQPISELNFEIVDGDFYELYHKQETDQDRVAVLLFIMKYAQLRSSVFYENSYRNEMMSKPDYYIKQLYDYLTKNLASYTGVVYQQQDVRELFYEMADSYKETDLIIMNPPAFAKGYEKMFDFGAYIKYETPADEFDFNAEWKNLYLRAKNDLVCPMIWYTSRPYLDVVPTSDRIYMSEIAGDKFTHIMCNKPNTLDGFKEKYVINYKKKSSEAVVHYELVDSDHELTMDDKLVIKEINKESALYYRDLFAHRLGSTVSELYFGIFLNGKLLSVCAFNTSFLRRLQANYIFESFCFSISHNKYENLNRLSMMCLCSGEYKLYLEANTLKNSAYVKLETFKTTCLTKYRKSKLNNNLLTLTGREKAENGTYKLTYEQPFYEDRDYKKCLELFLTTDVRVKKSWANNQEVVE